MIIITCFLYLSSLILLIPHGFRVNNWAIQYASLANNFPSKFSSISQIICSTPIYLISFIYCNVALKCSAISRVFLLEFMQDLWFWKRTFNCVQVEAPCCSLHFSHDTAWITLLVVQLIVCVILQHFPVTKLLTTLDSSKRCWHKWHFFLHLKEPLRLGCSKSVWGLRLEGAIISFKFLPLLKAGMMDLGRPPQEQERNIIN